MILAGILASTMSTADSQLLAASSGVSENILGSLFNLNLSAKAKMIVARVTRERIRQIEAKALRKLRHPSRSKKLKDFLD